ncbi:CCDC134 [Bugula neritina]|uniref:CCDC134 n=1 Tax=Bugula neritina TaxID=10212 RepID=A0A7J7KN59_BUGNE|nr:CCDC134 [Bugula neritina]
MSYILRCRLPGLFDILRVISNFSKTGLFAATILLLLGNHFSISFVSSQSTQKSSESASNKDRNQDITGEIKSTNSWEAYRVLLETQRKAHMEVIKHILSITQLEKQYDMLNIVNKKIIEVLRDSKLKLVEAEVVAGGQFPEDEDHRDHLSKLIQNTLLYGDLALRFPTFIHRQYDGKKTTQQLIKWCFDFVTKANITDGTSAEQTLHLASQELNIVDRGDNYQNPFQEEAEIKLSQLVKEEMKKSKKGKKKGPRLSNKKTEL